MIHSPSLPNSRTSSARCCCASSNVSVCIGGISARRAAMTSLKTEQVSSYLHSPSESGSHRLGLQIRMNASRHNEALPRIRAVMPLGSSRLFPITAVFSDSHNGLARVTDRRREGIPRTHSRLVPLNWGGNPLTPIFHTAERRVRARGLQERMCALVGRVPSRGALLAFPSECEMSKLKPQLIPDGVNPSWGRT